MPIQLPHDHHVLARAHKSGVGKIAQPQHTSLCYTLQHRLFRSRRHTFPDTLSACPIYRGNIQREYTSATRLAATPGKRIMRNHLRSCDLTSVNFYHGLVCPTSKLHVARLSLTHFSTLRRHCDDEIKTVVYQASKRAHNMMSRKPSAQHHCLG